MIKINGVAFNDKPGHCGSCPFFSDGFSSMCNIVSKGHCRLFDEMHGHIINIPARCSKLFNKAFKEPDGSDLIIVINK